MGERRGHVHRVCRPRIPPETPKQSKGRLEKSENCCDLWLCVRPDHASTRGLSRPSVNSGTLKVHVPATGTHRAVYHRMSACPPLLTSEIPSLQFVPSVCLLLSSQLYSENANPNRLQKNRWRTVHIICEQGGKPDKRGLTGPADAPVKKTNKNTSTKKVLL